MKQVWMVLALPIAITSISIEALYHSGGFKQIAQSENHIIKSGRVDTTLSGEWFLQPVLPSDSAAGKIPNIVFNLHSNNFSGNTGCNKMNGTFEIHDMTLIFSDNIRTTKMVCSGYDEQAFLKSLLSVNRFKIQNSVLVLMSDATELSRWTRKIQPKLKEKA